MAWKEIIITSIVSPIIVYLIIRFILNRKPSKTQLSTIFSANSKFRGFKDAYRIIMNDNLRDIDAKRKHISKNHLSGYKIEAQKMIEKKTHVHKAKKIIKLCEAESIEELLRYFDKIVAKLQKYHDKWEREYDK